ncbi:MAG: cardiolipin synthase [Cytophagales bacterium]|nr:cardiolipin synthase [Cytophagales bacterium]
MTQGQIILAILFSGYYAIAIFFFFRILLENKNPLKTQSYLLLMVLLPVIGMLIYLFFGVNYRKQKLYSRKGFTDQKIIQKWIREYDNLLSQSTYEVQVYLHEKAKLPFLFWRNNYSALSSNNDVKIFRNGEQKFPELIRALQNASHHIHMEYYIIDDDEIGGAIINILCERAQSGIEVRVIIDALGSNNLRKKTINKLISNGVEIYEYHPVIFTSLANRVNYRDHRKIVVIDGEIGFIGGINIADRYINNGRSQRYWRDTHCKIEGEAVYSLQILFILNWYFVSKKLLHPEIQYFPVIEPKGDVLTSIISSDPDSDNPNLMEGYFSMINTAKEEILIITPYFIPNESVLTALKTCAKGGVKVVLLMPEEQDSFFVHSASLTYMGELLHNDIQVYFYKKGMIHAKVMIIDEELSTIGTANMDYRSFDNNAEVNAVFFDQRIAMELKEQFLDDLAESEKLDYLTWRSRPSHIKLIGSVGRLVAPLL